MQAILRSTAIRRLGFVLFAFAVCVPCRIVLSDEGSAATSIDADILAASFREHCVRCHGGEEDVGVDVDLLDVTKNQLADDPALTQKLIEVLDLSEMPPEDEPTLPHGLRASLVSQLKPILHASARRHSSSSATPIRRMNRFQYNNAVVDLFDLNCIVFTLPERMMREHKGYFQPATGRMPDVVSVGSRPLGKSQMIEKRLAGVAAFPQDLRAEHGFDNRADHLSLSPLLMESFLKLGQSITQSPDFGPKSVGIWKQFFATPAKNADISKTVRNRLEPFLARAFRRPVTTSHVERYAAFVDRKIADGLDFTAAMKLVSAAVVASPNFLYLYDTATHRKDEERTTDYGLASRMSFFLWGSIPDEELLRLAVDGSLRSPNVFEAQVDRMLQDRKLKRFCDSFPSQWLQLERIISSVPDRAHFPEFYFSKYRDSMHMMLEPLLLFETVLIENLPITQLIDADFSYRSQHLEDAYGELATPKEVTTKGKSGQVGSLTFNRVPVVDRRNGGVITNAAVMTMTSGPERTQPITRGAWIATVIFNNPPDPPPADVPPLSEKPSVGEENLTLRERLSLHRERADCRGCHEQIDPLGFALENYNPIGVWRDTYDNGRKVDSDGVLFREHEFVDVVQFKDALVAEKDLFARALAGHILSYAVARELRPADELALDKIVAATRTDDYRIQTLLKQVIASESFQMTTAVSEKTVVDAERN